MGYSRLTGFAKLKVNTVKIKMHSTNKKLKRHILVDDIEKQKYFYLFF